MSSASAGHADRSGAPNDSRGFGGSPGPGIAGSPDASTAALQASATSRCASGGASATAPDDQPPALPWLGGHRTRRRGIGVHVC